MADTPLFNGIITKDDALVDDININQHKQLLFCGKYASITPLMSEITPWELAEMLFDEMASSDTPPKQSSADSNEEVVLTRRNSYVQNVSEHIKLEYISRSLEIMDDNNYLIVSYKGKPIIVTDLGDSEVLDADIKLPNHKVLPKPIINSFIVDARHFS